MSLSASQRFSRLWKSIAVGALLLIITGSLGIYLYAQRQYTLIRDSESRNHRAIISQVHQDLQAVSEQLPAVTPIDAFVRELLIQNYLADVFQDFPALIRILVLDQQGTIVWGRERPAITAQLAISDASRMEAEKRYNGGQPYEDAQTVQVFLTGNQQAVLFVRGYFVSTTSTASIDQLTRLALQIALIAIILMFVLGIALVFTQITSHLSSRQRRLEEYVVSLQQSNEHLLRAQKELQISEKLASLGYLAAGVAHEIGNPLAAALGYIELLQKTSFDAEKQRDILQRTQQEIERIRRIIQELVTFSRPHSMQRQIVDVNTLLREVIARTPAFSEKTLDIQLKLTKFSLFAEVDPQKLQSVLYNILCNAVDAISHSGQIVFSTSRRIRESSTMIGSSEVIAIQCADTGSGIPDDQLSRIFEPFFTTKDPGKGMGLGLSLCHRIVESLNGEMTIQSAVGQGTTVTIYLPPASKPKES